MTEIRTICRPVDVLCHVSYYVLAKIADDPHFAPSPPYVVDDRYFETREEAEAFKETCHGWATYSVCEKITPLE